MSNSEDDDEGGNTPVTAEAVAGLIAAAVEPLRAAIDHAEKREQKLARKLAEAERVIAAQAKDLLAKKEEKEKEEEEFCKYGDDGRGGGNVYPRRDLNDPDLTKPHHYDVSEDPTYKHCDGRFKSFKHEYRTLAAVGSYLADFEREIEPILADLRDSENPNAAERESDRKWGRELTNTLHHTSLLVAGRFNFVKEFVSPNSEESRLKFLFEKLYPREGVAGPSSQLTAWNAEFDARKQLQVDKQYALQAAKAHVGAAVEETGRRKFVPRPRKSN